MLMPSSCLFSLVTVLLDAGLAIVSNHFNFARCLDLAPPKICVTDDQILIPVILRRLTDGRKLASCWCA